MDDQKLSRRCGAQIGDLPSCLMIDILSRLPPRPLLMSRSVCKSWLLLFSDPLFLKLQLTQSSTRVLRRKSGHTKHLLCTSSKVDEDLDFDANVTLPDSYFTCANSCRGLLCLESVAGCNQTFVCNPMLGEYITIPTTLNMGRLMLVKSVLGFCSRSNKFKLLQIHRNENEPPAYKAQIYTIGDRTRQWKSIGIAPSCINDFPDDSVDTFLNGSIHWADEENHRVLYFDFESEQFGSLPSPPALRDGRWSNFSQVRVGVSAGCLCIYAFPFRSDSDTAYPKKWLMTEYGVEESWTPRNITSDNYEPPEVFYAWDHLCNQIRCRRFGNNSGTTSYSPSFVSLQDVANGEDLTVLSKTRTMMDY